MSRFEQVWAGAPEAILRPLPTPAPAAAPAGVGRLRDFAAQLGAKLPSPPTQLAINQAKLRLSNRLHAELALLGAREERLALFEAFAELYGTLCERDLEVAPPELVEHIFVRDPAPTSVSPQQAIGFFLPEEEG